MTRKIFGVGETVLDIVFKNDQPVAAVPGGSSFNAIVSLGRSVGIKHKDIPIYMVTEVGDDHVGDIVTDFLATNNIKSDCVTRRHNSQTHISMAFLNDRNDAQYEFYKDHEHAMLSAEKVNAAQPAADDVLLTGSFFSINPAIRAHTRSINQRVSEAGAIMYYDVNFRKAHIKDLPMVFDNIIENFGFSDIVRGSTEDFGLLFGTTDPCQIYDGHISKHCPIFICTDGPNPITLITPKFTAKYPAKKIETVSTIGAGDNFNAGVICAIIDEGLTKSELVSADKALWDKLISNGQAFSAEVCQSIYNYIQPR